MGRGTIAGGGTDGLYSLTLDYGAATREAWVTKVTADLATLATKVAEAQAVYDAQKAIENQQRVIVESAIDVYVAKQNAIAPAFEALKAAEQAVTSAQNALDAIFVAAAGTLPDVTASQNQCAPLLTALNDAVAAAQVGQVQVQALADAALAAVTGDAACLANIESASSALVAAQNTATAAADTLVAALQLHGSAPTEQAAFDTADNAVAMADAVLQMYVTGLDFSALPAALLALRDAQADQAILDAAVLTAAQAYLDNNLALLAVYMASGDATETIKGAFNANFTPLHEALSDTLVAFQVATDNLTSLGSPLNGLENTQQSAATDVVTAADTLLVAASVLTGKRIEYIGAATADPAVFDAAQTSCLAASDDLASAKTDLTPALSDMTDAQAALSTGFDGMRVAILLAVGWLEQTVDPAADYVALVGSTLSSFTLTPIAVDAARQDAVDALAGAKMILITAKATYINAQAAIKPALDDYTATAKNLVLLKQKTAAFKIQLDLLKAEQTKLNKDLAEWTALTLTETVSAWCIDLTEHASGAVATVEIPGENKLVLIAPKAPAPTAPDGLLTAREVQSAAQVFWNAAVLPGWQKWMPTYRRGTIVGINYEADTANVVLFEDVSSALNLPINQTSTLTAIPVEYMQCDAEAFEVGDVCVVKFIGMEWSNPKVIGFCDHPKSCLPKQLFVSLEVNNNAEYHSTTGRQLLTGPHADIHYDSNRAWGVFADWKTQLAAFAARAPVDWGGSGLSISLSTAPIHRLDSDNGTVGVGQSSYVFLLGPDTITMPSGEVFTAPANSILVIHATSPAWPVETWLFDLGSSWANITGEHMYVDHGALTNTAVSHTITDFVAAGTPPVVSATLGSVTKIYTFNPAIPYNVHGALVYER